MTSKNLKNEIADIVSGAELGAWLELSTEEISANADVLARGKARGRYRLRESVGRYCERLRQSASGRETPHALERRRVLKATADLAELRSKFDAGEMLDIAVIEARWSSTFRNVRSLVMALPSRIAALLPHLDRREVNEIDSEVRAALTEVGQDHSRNHP
jgi:phage terminase Nu1 subunit (DNA packaging protein)